ncbi:MAG: hypothetical protein ABFC96_01255 [Thermoguttaceae bacterium]
MRALLLTLAGGLLIATTAGCIIPAYSGDPVRRTQELMFTSENLRLFLDEWERVWFLDQPSHLTPYRTHGGII